MVPTKEYYSRVAEDTATRKLRLIAALSSCSSRLLARNLIYGPKLPSWPFPLQLVVEVIRYTMSWGYEKYTDDDLGTIDIVAMVRKMREYQLAAEADISSTCDMGQFDLLIEGESLLACPDHIFSDLYKADAAASQSVAPRSIVGEIIVSHEAAEALIERGGDRNKLVSLAPVVDGETVLIHFHGGAYIQGSPATIRTMVAKIAQSTGLRVIVPDYRLAPESPFPAQLHDGYLIWKKLMDSGFEPGNVFISGDSSGGNLALALLLLLKKVGSPMPRGAVLLSPSTCLSKVCNSHIENEKYDYLKKIPISSPLNSYRLFVAPGKPLSAFTSDILENPLISPIFGDFTDCPPMLVQVGDKELLYDDACELARIFDNQDDSALQGASSRNQKADSQFKLEVYKDMPHVFQALPVAKEASEAIASIGNWVRKHINVDNDDDGGDSNMT
ncbi:hypothetical protein H4219_001962 [Mycoemilia scoparia]|uniref:Alpha/beta hydrolase fold-3 domain-containing protein n=1 Tax=Mycoemilia scoparia TaxID=417184 RepID=A0A9W8DUQ6_9FUNG|nr:hypothetical protein H4219_001962 [Mycoemilia scoparia]